jgi:hypothetical protein
MTERYDAVRDAFARYVQRFPEVREATLFDPMTSAMFKQMERMLVCADMAMQDEGLDPDQRRRVISAALYGGPNEESAARALDDRKKQMETIKSLRLRGAPVPEDLQ